MYFALSKGERAKILNPCANAVFQTACVPDAHKTGEIFPTAQCNDLENPDRFFFFFWLWVLVKQSRETHKKMKEKSNLLI